MSGTTSVFDQPLNGDIDDVAEGLVILIDGDTAPRAITSGQYLFIKNHSTLATGGYHATAAIASGASITSSNVAADANGIVNALDGKVSALNSNISGLITTGIFSFSYVTANTKRVVNDNFSGNLPTSVQCWFQITLTSNSDVNLCTFHLDGTKVGSYMKVYFTSDKAQTYTVRWFQFNT